MASIRESVLDAAVELVGTQGVRALTHGRIDDAASVPRGSTSNYFRTRAALVTGVVEWIMRTEQEAMRHSGSVEAESVDDLVERVATLVDFLTGPHRLVTSARLALFMEAAHDEEIRPMIQRGHHHYAAMTAGTFAELGVADPGVAALTLMTCLDGIILHRIVRHDDADARPLIAAVVRGIWDRPA